ncbi:HDOD domain-containing protein [Aestuariirhabdus litorea]|uniref:HDOD domain-containing protein n=1 Tax=Aestuariirhabdus litorea TaxID=2528527 RepID=A0A3P3VQ87_9GAMM|nr:HDOD domain-containing protein [Aestuariirhabdus litorea]RRJ84895.1 HDOD domain-containing protein [Aestuariirhabdus litorea]RWW98121.1 HDOD domain-containing protein [Endozoicomonadaceae bacterium GTF-13]
MEKGKGRSYWLQRFEELKMPAISSVLHEFEALTDHQDMATIQQMADVIMKDASLTASLLKAANTVYYNPSKTPINTVSRAIVLLGLKAVKMLCVSVMVIEQLMGEDPPDRLYYCLALSFHAAVQAKNISGYVDRRKQEEVFIAALLYNLGELCFWALKDRVSLQLYSQLIHQPEGADEVVAEELGVSFRELTEGLAKNWGLSELLNQSFAPAARLGGLGRCVVLGNEVSRAAMEGWDNPKIPKLFEEIARLTKAEPEEVEALVLKNAEESMQVVGSFGVDKLVELIPAPDTQTIREKLQDRCTPLLKADRETLKEQLDLITAMQEESVDLNRLAAAVLTALHEGAGVERVGIFLQPREQQPLMLHYSRVADRAEDLPKSLKRTDDLFGYVMRYRETLWLGIPGSVGLRDLYDSAQAKAVTGGQQCFCGALFTSRRVIGVVYADNRVSGVGLEPVQFQSLQEVLRRANRALAI